MQISEITATDIPNLTDLQPEGWTDITKFYKFYLNSGFCNPIKISIGNQIAGIGTSILHGSTAWLAHIIVHKEFRNKGIGTKITSELLDRLNKTKYSTVSLIATELGEPVYKKNGFEKETEYWFFRKESPVSFDFEESQLADDNSLYFNDIIEMDKSASGENRYNLLEPHLPKAKIFIEGNKLSGFYMPSLNEGLIIAESAYAGIELLKLKLNSAAFAIIPKENEVAASFLEKNGFLKFLKGSRMRLGKPLSFRGDKVFNRIGGNLG